MEKSADQSLVILKWKKYRKHHSREVTTDSDSHLPERQRRAQTQQSNSQNDEPSTTRKPYYNRRQKTYNLRNKSKAESTTDKVRTLPASEKQQSSRNPQHGQKDDDDIEQSNQLIRNAINSDTTSMGGGDTTSMADSKDSNEKYNPNSYEFPLRHFAYSQKQGRTNPKTNFTQISERTLQLNDESNTECTSSKMIASFPNNNGDHHIRAEQEKSNGDEDSTKSREAIEINYKEQNIGPITRRRDVGTTTSNDKPKSYKHAKGKQKIHQSDVITKSDCSSNQTFDTNIPDQRKTLKKTQPHQQKSRQQKLHPFNRKQSSNKIRPLHRRNQQTTDNDSNYQQSSDDESNDHQQIDNIRLSNKTQRIMNYNQKDKEPEKEKEK